MKKLILSTVIAFASVLGMFAAENGTTDTQAAVNTVSGQVLDKTTNEALAGVAVIANGQKVYTDFDGNFTVSNLCGDKCTIVVSQISYEPQVLELNLQNAQSLNVSLAKR